MGILKNYAIVGILLFLISGFFGQGCGNKDQAGIYGNKTRFPDSLLSKTRNKKADGYHGIWYSNTPSDNEYVYKYSGGLGTYCAKHKSFAVYSEKANKTFFCYGGTNDSGNTLLHMVSYFDHETGKVPRPTLLLDKKTRDAHDNPVMTIDGEGYIWIFSTSHGTARPSYIHKSKKPFSINEFERIDAVKMEDGEKVPMNNFSYMQPWYLPGQGFINFFTRYSYPVDRTPCFMTSKDGKNWSEWQRLATIGLGHYQISAHNDQKAGSAMNYHPHKPEKDLHGLNWRTNLYYLETRDFGKTWQNAAGVRLDLPIDDVKNPALVHDYESEGLLVYIKDIRYDPGGNPVILYITSKGWKPGPENAPRTWRTAYWNGVDWEINAITTSDNNYDMGSLYLEKGGTWRVIGPTMPGPQKYNPGGEMIMWVSEDKGKNWQKIKQMTANSKYNHTYARKPVNAHPGFYAIWADGHGRQPSPSRLYFSNKDGDIYMLPEKMEGDFAKPRKIQPLNE